MTVKEMAKIFSDWCNDDLGQNIFLEFVDFKNKPNPLREVCGIMMLQNFDKTKVNNYAFVQNDGDMSILAFDPEEVAKNATEEDINDLLRCGKLMIKKEIFFM